MKDFIAYLEEAGMMTAQAAYKQALDKKESGIEPASERWMRDMATVDAVISKSPWHAIRYAIDVLGMDWKTYGRPDVERAIAKSGEDLAEYRKLMDPMRLFDHAKKRGKSWPELLGWPRHGRALEAARAIEAIIEKHPTAGHAYARDVLDFFSEARCR